MLAGILGTAFLAAYATGTRVLVPWHAGTPRAFRWARSKSIEPAARGCFRSRCTPAGAGPFPFACCCTGAGPKTKMPAGRSGRPWADSLPPATWSAPAVVDCLGPRGVDQVRTGDVAPWAVRRADDAYSARAWSAAQPDVDGKHIGRDGDVEWRTAVLAALHDCRPERFVAGVALYSGCQTDVSSTSMRRSRPYWAGGYRNAGPLLRADAPRNRLGARTQALVIRAARTRSTCVFRAHVLGMQLGYVRAGRGRRAASGDGFPGGPGARGQQRRADEAP